MHWVVLPCYVVEEEEGAEREEGLVFLPLQEHTMKNQKQLTQPKHIQHCSIDYMGAPTTR